MRVYFPAVTKKEAKECIEAGFWHATKAEADKHLKAIKDTADPFYGSQYRVYGIDVDQLPQKQGNI